MSVILDDDEIIEFEGSRITLVFAYDDINEVDSDDEWTFCVLP